MRRRVAISEEALEAGSEREKRLEGAVEALPSGGPKGSGEGCNHSVLTQDSGTLTSKNYPGTYPNYTSCKWRILVPQGKKIILKFGDLNIEAQQCESDYLKIFTGSSAREYDFLHFEPTEQHLEYETYCGNESSISEEFLLDTNELTLHFKSSSHISGRGFLLSYATSDHSGLITCLDKANHYSEKEYRKYCPAGCKDIAGEVSGDSSEGYRHTSVLCKAAIHAGVITDELGGQITVTQYKGLSQYEGIVANGILSQNGSLSDKKFMFNNNGILTTGSTLSNFNYFVKTYKISYSENGQSWILYKSVGSNEEKIFEGNTDYLHLVRNNFIPPFVARSLRIIPDTWNQRIAMKVELIGCPPGGPNSSPPLKPSLDTPTKDEDQNITEPVPSEELDLGLRLAAIVVPAVLFLVLLVVGICICGSLRKKKTKVDACSSDVQKTGCWKNLKQPFARHQSTEFTISYNNEKETPQRLDLVPCDMADYEHPLIGTGTVTRKGSTFRPMDTETKDNLGRLEPENHYDCPHVSTRHEYALPLTNQEPEYATPIIERHTMGKSTFASESGYHVPGLTLAKPSFAAGDFSRSHRAGASGGGYQVPQSLIDYKKNGKADYDRPKINGTLTSAGSRSDHQQQQSSSAESDGYSAPRDCLIPASHREQ
ncbi:discoidin, CUB and LCCL domain-containing protein 1 [Latimeria chalumnae]|uniref:discoidin, CUB and LCCL domain-containing protein 1 n=1 Tax=Latimeria chalumnae TaxID=7897 RepID=UPI00313AD7A3